MAYSNAIKEDAFGFYCTGISFDAIAEAMQNKHPEDCAEITRQTIATWEKKYNWAARREVIENRTREKLDAKRISKRAELIAEMEILEQALIDHSKKMVPKSLEGTINSLLGLSKFILLLRGEGGNNKSIGEKDLESAITIIFEVLSEDEKIGARLRERQDFILQQIQERLEKE